MDTEMNMELIEAVRTDAMVGATTSSHVNSMSDAEVWEFVKHVTSTRGARSVMRKIHNEVAEKAEVSHAKGKYAKEFDVNERFEFVADLTRVVAAKKINSLVVSGPGGMGKSHEIFKVLKDLGLLKPGQDFILQKGYCRPRSLFDLMRDNPEAVLLFDDCDTVLRDRDAVNILKGAVDTGNRQVNWTNSKEEACDTQFTFNGSIIFITNMILSDVPQPILSRSFFVDVSMTPDEKIERMRKVLADFDVQIPMVQREEVLAFINKIRHDVHDLNMRTFLKVAKIRQEFPDRWQKLALYQATTDLGE